MIDIQPEYTIAEDDMLSNIEGTSDVPCSIFATRKPTSTSIFLHAFPDIQMTSTVSWQTVVVGGGHCHQALTPDEIQVDIVEDDDTHPSINSTSIHQGTGKEDNLTTDVKVRQKMSWL